MEEKRGFAFEGENVQLTLTELQERLQGCPTKHVMAVWMKASRIFEGGPPPSA